MAEFVQARRQPGRQDGARPVQDLAGAVLFLLAAPYSRCPDPEAAGQARASYQPRS
jgi:hypothetical protein